MAYYAYQLSDGIDLTEIEGVSYGLLLTIISEVGLDLSKFPSSKHFASWLGLSPNTKISGGKILSSKTKKNRLNFPSFLWRILRWNTINTFPVLKRIEIQIPAYMVDGDRGVIIIELRGSD